MQTIVRIKLIGFLFVFFGLNTSCQQTGNYAKLISPDSLNVLLKGEHGILLDVRTPEEYNSGHIPGAINIDFRNENFSSVIDTLDKNMQYELYCRSGKRSTEATEMMQKKGFKKLLNLDGGIVNWQEKGLPTE